MGQPAGVDTGFEFGLPESGPLLGKLRAWIADCLAGEDDAFVQDVALVATELVSNAYDHAEAPRSLRLLCGSAVRVEVDDGSPERDVMVGRSRLGDSRGRGVMIVKNIGSRWGVLRKSGLKTVWAELARVAPEPPLGVAAAPDDTSG